MGITCDRGRWYWVKRVPRRFQGLVRGADGRPESQVRQTLHTDSRSEALRKAAQVEAARLAEWEALAAGHAADARRHYEAARALAAARGVAYRPVEALAAGDLAGVVERVLQLGRAGQLTASRAEVEAMLGAVPEALPTLGEVLAEHVEATRAGRLKKSPQGEKHWRQGRERAVREFLAVIGGDRPVDQITRAEALKFREHLAARVTAGGFSAGAANKQIGHLNSVWQEWTRRHGHDLPSPFAGLRLPGGGSGRRPPFSPAWVRDRLLAPGALDGMNDQARDVLLVMVNTGLGPSEIIGAGAGDWQLGHHIPHVRIHDAARELKVGHCGRDIPLLGVTLEAGRRIAERGGVPRSADKATHWSNAANKYLRGRGLLETPAHSAYSLRHYVEDALLDAGVDERVRVDILGHKYGRPRYGVGGGLEARRAALARIAL